MFMFILGQEDVLRSGSRRMIEIRMDMRVIIVVIAGYKR